MTGQVDQDILLEGAQKAQECLTEIDSGAVQTIPGDIALAQNHIGDDLLRDCLK
jgi:hypothetical protein